MIAGFAVFVLSVCLAIVQTGRSVKLGQENNLIVEGKPVDYIFFPGEQPLVSHGEFRFENKTSKAKTCAIKACAFSENGALVPVESFWIYAGETLLEREVTLPATSELRFRVTFPAREVHVGSRFKYEVRLTVECQGKHYVAASKVNVTQEK
jgi:hypothetical protein